MIFEKHSVAGMVTYFAVFDKNGNFYILTMRNGIALSCGHRNELSFLWFILTFRKLLFGNQIRTGRT